MLPTSELNEITAGFDGRIGVYVRDIASGATYEHFAGERFPTASAIKLPVLIELYRQVEAGTLRLDERRRLHDGISRLFASGTLRMFGEDPELTLRDYARAMIIVSDDVAADVLMDAVGIENVNETMASLGCADTRGSMSMGTWHYAMFGLAHLPPSLDGDEFVSAKFRSEGIDHSTVSFSDSLENNVASPADMGALLERLDRGEIVSPAASESMVGLLKECQDRGKIARHLKPGVAGRAQGRLQRPDQGGRRDRLPAGRAAGHRGLRAGRHRRASCPGRDRGDSACRGWGGVAGECGLGVTRE